MHRSASAHDPIQAKRDANDENVKPDDDLDRDQSQYEEEGGEEEGGGEEGRAAGGGDERRDLTLLGDRGEQEDAISAGLWRVFVSIFVRGGKGR